MKRIQVSHTVVSQTYLNPIQLSEVEVKNLEKQKVSSPASLGIKKRTKLRLTPSASTCYCGGDINSHSWKRSDGDGEDEAH